VIEHDYQSTLAETARMSWRGNPAIVEYAVLFVDAEVKALVVKQVVAIPKRSMSQELHPRLSPDPLGADAEGADRHKVDMADLRGQFLKHFLPRRDGLSPGADEVVQKNHGILSAKAGPEEVAPADEKGVKFPVV
jgi:hypothetical protein